MDWASNIFLWRLLDVCLVRSEDPALVTRWIPKLAPAVDYHWRMLCGRGELRHLHGLASRWPLSFDGFDEMHEVLVAAGADASFTPRYGENANKTAKQVHGERCRRHCLRTGITVLSPP